MKIMSNSLCTTAVMKFGVIVGPDRRAELAQLQAHQQCQLMQAQTQAEAQCRSQLQPEYQQAQMIGALIMPVGMKEASFSPQPGPVEVFDQYGRDELEIADEGDQIVARIMFWQQIPLIGKWIAAMLAEQLEGVADTLERLLQRKQMAHG